MTAKDIILLTLGIGTCDDKIDDICEGFNLELTTDIVEDCLNNADTYDQFQNKLIDMLYDKVIDCALDEYGLSEALFVKYCNGRDSSLRYDNDVVDDWDEIEEHGFHCPECGCVLKQGEYRYDEENDCLRVECCPECGCEGEKVKTGDSDDDSESDEHHIYDTAYGEVMVKPNGDCFIGDNYDQYVGNVGPWDECDDIDKAIDKLFNKE